MMQFRRGMIWQVARSRVGLAATALFLFANAHDAFAQRPSEPVGKHVLVVSDNVGLPVQFASVILNGGNVRITNAEGRVDLGNSVKDTIKVLVRRIGYQPFEGKMIANSPGGSFAVTLGRTSQTLTTFEVSGARVKDALERTGFYDRMLESQHGVYNGEYYTPEVLGSRSGMKVSQVLNNSRFARVEYKAGMAVVRGRGGCPMAIVVDGHRINALFQGLNKPNGIPPTRGENGLTIDDIVDAGDIAAMEIYPHVGNAPAALQPLTGNGSCGLIAIWTGGR